MTYNYSSGLNSTISRLSSLSDSTGTLESYSYMGLGTVVVRSHPQINVDLTYVGTHVTVHRQSANLAGMGRRTLARATVAVRRPLDSSKGESPMAHPGHIRRPGERLHPAADAGDEYAGLDRFGRVVEQLWVNTSTSTTLDDFQYSYDVLGNRTAIDNGVNSSFSQSLSYDALSQLTGFTQGTHTQDFNYDAVGNATAVTTDGTEQDRTANAQNQITSISGATTPTYDSNGNMTGNETGLIFVFDAWNHLVKVKNSGGTTLETFAYDGLGRRVTSNDGTTTTDLYYSTQQQVLEEMQGGSATARYVWSPVYVNALVLRDRATGSPGTLNERLWAQQDANFNVTALVDGSGAVVERYVYDPYGAVTIYSPDYSTLRSSSSYAITILFQGMRYDATSGLYEADERWYSPILQTWTSQDPISFSGGSRDLYDFLSDNPLTHVDASGLSEATIPVDSFQKDFKSRQRGLLPLAANLLTGVLDKVAKGGIEVSVSDEEEDIRVEGKTFKFMKSIDKPLEIDPDEGGTVVLGNGVEWSLTGVTRDRHLVNGVNPPYGYYHITITLKLRCNALGNSKTAVYKSKPKAWFFIVADGQNNQDATVRPRNAIKGSP